MHEEKFNKISNYYNDLVEDHGHHFRACDYGRSESQILKFEVLSQVANLDDKTILDVGCGFCDYSDYLKKIYSNVDYHGIDISGKMVQKAKQLHPDLNISLSNIIDVQNHAYDVVSANGIFYLLEEDAWGTMKQLVATMFDVAKEAIAFNTLSIKAVDKEAGEFYADPAAVIDFCQTLTPYILLRHDYLQHDFTVYMYKQKK